MIREELQQRLNLAINLTDDPATVFCIEPFSTVDRDSGKQLGLMLSRLMADPNAFLISTADAFVFAFGNKLGQSTDNAPASQEADSSPSSSA